MGRSSSTRESSASASRTAPWRTLCALVPALVLGAVPCARAAETAAAVRTAKRALAERGIALDANLALYHQQANKSVTGKKGFSTFAWEALASWELLDLREDASLSGLGRGYLGLTALGSSGLNYDPGDATLSASTGSIFTLNANVVDDHAILNEVYWKQLALDGDLEVRAGMVDLLEDFDTNRIANDAFSEFFAFGLENNPSIPAPLYGGFGGLVRWNLAKDAYLMLGTGDSSTEKPVPPWTTLDEQSWYQLLQLAVSREPRGLGKGNYRLIGWHNHRFHEDGFGIALSVDQELGREDLVGFARAGWGDHEVTAIERFGSAGLALLGPLGRDHDRLAIALAWSDPSDGRRSETLFEMYYSFAAMQAISISPDLQVVFNPSNNRDDDVIYVAGIRLHARF